MNQYFKTSKLFTSVFMEKIVELSILAGKTTKEYFYDDKNILHISLVFYDFLPLTVKIGLRHDKFHENFSRIFKNIRNQLITTEVVKEKESIAKNFVLKVAAKKVKKEIKK